MNHSLNLVDLGRRVRAARQARGLTLEEVVSRTDFTVSWLSKLENGQLSPSLEGLVKIAAVLECGVDTFVEGLSASPRHVVCRHGEGGVARPQKNGPAGVTVENLAEAWRGRRMQPSILTVSRTGGRRPPEVFPGERFLLVLDGDVRFAYGEDVVPLAVGDSVYFDATVPHVIAAAGRSARVLSVACEVGAEGRAAAARMNGRAKRTPSSGTRG